MWNVCDRVFSPFELFPRQLWNVRIPQALMYVYVSLFDDQQQITSPRLTVDSKQMCLAPEKKQVLSPFFPLRLSSLNFSDFQKGCKQQQKGQLCLSFSSMQLLPSVPVQCQLLPVTGVKTESQSFSGRWLFSKFIFVVGLRM